MMHSILAPQLHRLGLHFDRLPIELTSWQELLGEVEEAYDTLEQGRNRLEESLRESARRIRILEESVAKFEQQTAEQSQDLFERTPVPTWAENFDPVAVWLEHLRSSGVEDLEQHLEDNPEDLRSAVSLIEVTSVNRAAVRLVGAKEEAVLLGPLDPQLVDDESAPSFTAQLMAIWNRSDSIRTPMVGRMLGGEAFDGILKWQAPRILGSPDYTRVLLTITDISDQKAAERQARERITKRNAIHSWASSPARQPISPTSSRICSSPPAPSSVN